MGCRFRLPKNRSFAENRYLSLMLGMVEPQWKDYFDRYIVKSRVFLDIGAASDGYYTFRACKLNPRIKCVAVEPLPTEYRYLLLNIDLNSCSNRVIPINAALGEEQRVIELSVPSSWYYLLSCPYEIVNQRCSFRYPLCSSTSSSSHCCRTSSSLPSSPLR
jgi:hypothetical protein